MAATVVQYFAGPYCRVIDRFAFRSKNAADLIRRMGAGSSYVLAAALALTVAACKVGPDFSTPSAPLARNYLESNDPSVKSSQWDDKEWWTVYHDQTLDRLIHLAYEQNLTLMAAGTRVLEARATLGVAIGELYPQTQQLGGNVGYNQASAVDPSSNPSHELENYWRASLGAQVAWEVDFWGKFRRGVESADASYLASIATYDDVLVTLLGDVASSYIGIRTLQQQLAITRGQRHQAEKGAGHCAGSLHRRHCDQTGRVSGRERAGADRIGCPATNRAVAAR